MKLSVIIPVYNAEKFIKRCLDSVLAQSIKEKEIICVDDGSTDGSLNILEEYEERYEDFYVLRQENKFAGTARNHGLSVARGEYVHFLDADDYILGDIYSSVYDLAKKMDADYIKTRNIAFDMRSGEIIRVPTYTLEGLNIQYFNQLLSLREHPEMLLCSSVTPWCGWVRRNYIVEKGIRFNNLKCVNDRSFYAEVISNTDRIILCDYYMVAHQINNSESLVGGRTENYICQLESYRIIESKIKKFSKSIRKRIMTVEFHSILGGFGELSDEQKKRNGDLLREFFADFDWKDIGKSILLNPLVWEVSKQIKIDLKDFFDTQLIIDSIADLESCLKDKESIVIYGAGRVCRVLVEYIKKKYLDMEICIVVSDMKNNPEYIFEVPVRKFSTELFDNTQEIIIATLLNAQLSIYFDLMKAGYGNIQAISDGMYKKLSFMHING